jgi:uncharacterized protein YeaO (DUF488 family)
MTKAGAAVKTKRAYDDPAPDDGRRVLVDRLWPRGISKERAHVDLWLRDVAPSDDLRKWYGHEPEKWDEFRRRYRDELRTGEAAAALAQLRDLAREGPLTLVYAARDSAHANAAVLAELLADGKR